MSLKRILVHVRRAHGIRPQRVLILAAALLSPFVGGGPAGADSTKEQVCAEVAAKAQRQIWDSVRETGDELFCRKPWVQRRPDEFAACALTNTVNTFGNKLKNRWNAFFANTGAEWAQWGPRGVSEEWESGQIRGGFRRVFFGPALAHSTSTVEVIKEDGQAEGIITSASWTPTAGSPARSASATPRAIKRSEPGIASSVIAGEA
jgi:hypothetical protein